jgi:hypothetical protein
VRLTRRGQTITRNLVLIALILVTCGAISVLLTIGSDLLGIGNVPGG